MNPTDIARRWIDAFNQHDLTALVSLYVEDAVHLSPKLREARPETLGLIRGRSALTDWWQDAFTRLPSLRYELKSITADSERAFIVYTRHVTGSSPLTVAEQFEVRNGQIVTSQVFHG